MRRHIARRPATERAACLSVIRRRTGLVDRGHCILEGTAGGEMLARADTALDLLVLELVLHASLFAAGLLGLRRLHLPVDAGAEDDVLADGGRVERRPRRVALLVPELRPSPPLRDPRVHLLPHHVRLDPPRHLHLLPVVVEPVRHHRLRAVFVRRHLLRGERGGVVELLVVGPVGAAGGFLVSGCYAMSSLNGVLTLLVETFCRCGYGRCG